MSWRLISLVACALIACSSGSMKVKKGEPQTAREKMLAEEKKNPSEPDARPPGSKKWNGWRYQGERKDCFFIVGKRCFKTEKAACKAAGCKAPSRCETEGAGPARMSCSKTGDEKPEADEEPAKPEQGGKGAKAGKGAKGAKGAKGKKGK